MNSGDEVTLAIPDQSIGLDSRYCFERRAKLNIRRQWSFSGQDYTVKDENGNVLLRSHGTTFVFRQYIIRITDHLDRELFICVRQLPDPQFDVYVSHSQRKVFEVEIGYTFNNGRAKTGTRTRFTDHLTGEDKEIAITWNSIRRKRGLFTVRNNCGHDGTNENTYGEGLPIGRLNDYDTKFDYIHPQVDMTANIDYTLLAITAICSESLTG